MMNIILLLLSLGIILLGCELFTNGIEWLGKKLGVGDGVVGSIFSAVGTCLPETMVPIIAIVFSGSSDGSEEIGIGAIMGAPFMLSTLAFFITGASCLVFWRKRRTGFRLNVNNKILSRDLGFFIVVYSIGISAAFIHSQLIKMLIVTFLIVYYIYYIILTVKRDQVSHCDLEPLYLVKLMNTKANLSVIMFQIMFSLLAILFGAHLFVGNIKIISNQYHIPALVLSLIVTPIATELPEKFNSIIWISKRKDTLALGNISGAMVFQSCIPVSIGILLTDWVLDEKAIVSAVLAILSGMITFMWLKVFKKLSPLPLMAGGILYAAFLGYIARTMGW